VPWSERRSLLFIAQYHHGSVELGSNNPGLFVRVKLPELES